MDDAPHNLFSPLPNATSEEAFTELLKRPGIRIERIVSQGQITPDDTPYDQPHDEWVLLLAGAAKMWLEGSGERELIPGDTAFIPAHIPHKVTWTQCEPPTIWLAVHLET